MKAKKLMFDTTTPAGLMIVGVQNKENLDDVFLAIVSQGAQGGNALGIQFDKHDCIKELHAGTVRHQNYIVAQRKCSEPIPDGVDHQIIMVGSRCGNFNFCSDEAATQVIEAIRSAGEKSQRPLVVFSQSINDTRSLLLSDTLSQFRAESKASNVLCIVLLAHNEGFENCELAELCEEFLQVEDADPDFDQDLAFTFDTRSLRGMRRMGVDKTMCSMSYDNHRIRQTFAPFICKNIKGRAVWYLHCAGRTNVQIAKIVKLHPSNVSRYLQKMPRIAPVVMPEEWLTKMLDYLDGYYSDEDSAVSSSFQKPSSRSSMHKVSDDDDEEDDLNDDEDFSNQ